MVALAFGQYKALTLPLCKNGKEAIKVNKTLEEQLGYAREAVRKSLLKGAWDGVDFWRQRLVELEDRKRCQECRFGKER